MALALRYVKSLISGDSFNAANCFFMDAIIICSDGDLLKFREQYHAKQNKLSTDKCGILRGMWNVVPFI